ncbi:hypothetical protein KL932_000896 [Ogataea haglerorum]|uniref:Genetic interactor of prohibitins 3, mitochondrial n=1 Tax=Ogataea haglerorum TaxID=1937702 RepID=A0ABQ7RK48_9ASCO|nr:hypothetical protein KL932_000896 [Ogataea haglerorum]KAG7767244.1 hypothetical protein KL946_001343 [Ogataea haglerorum]KAG7812693.1 hypothetical protein KL924_001441 [Ogataea haglerorum]
MWQLLYSCARNQVLRSVRPTGAFRLVSSVPRKAKCASCGYMLQNADPGKPGYTKYSSEDNKRQKPQIRNHSIPQEKEQAILEELRSMMGNLPVKSSELRAKKGDEKPMCLRCYDAVHHNVYNPDEHVTVAVEEAMSEIPSNAKIVHVISALDFPLGASAKVLQNRDPSKIYYVISKLDLFFNRDQYINSEGTRYFAQVLQRLVGADPTKVRCVTARNRWGVRDLYSWLPQGNLYFIGETNSGKSRLIESLCRYHEYVKREEIQSTPGVSNWPGFTRDFMKYVLPKRDTTLIDTVGFAPPQEGIFKYMLSEHIPALPSLKKPPTQEPNGHRLQSLSVKTAKYYSGDKVFSIGGYFYLRPPCDCALRIFPGMSGKQFNQHSIEKAIHTSLNRERSVASNFSVNKLAVQHLERHVIPIFYGTVDLVFRDIGFLTIAPTGKPKIDELFELWVPKGVDVVVREPIFRYIYPRTMPKDPDAPRLSKYRKVPEDKLIYTKIFPVSEHKTKAELLEEFDPDGSIRRHFESVESQDSYRNPGWVQPEL